MGEGAVAVEHAYAYAGWVAKACGNTKTGEQLGLGGAVPGEMIDMSMPRTLRRVQSGRFPARYTILPSGVVNG